MSFFYNSLLYIGAGLDVQTLLHFPFVRKFVLLDGAPMCEFGDPEPLLYGDYTPDTWYKKEFIARLFESFQEKNFQYARTDTFGRVWAEEANERLYFQDLDSYPFHLPTRIQFMHPTKRLANYYVSAPFQEKMSPEVELAVKLSDAVLIKGFVPGPTFAHHCQTPKTWFIHENYQGTGEWQENNILATIKRAGKKTYRKLVKRAYMFHNEGFLTEIEDIRAFLS